MGIVYLGLSIVFFSAMGIGVKVLTSIPFYEIIFFRSIISASLCYAILKRKKIPVFGPAAERPWFIARGIIGVISLCCFFICLKEMNLAYAITLHQTAPIFILAISAFIFKKQIHGFQWIGVGIAILGIFWTYEVNVGSIDWLVTIGIIGAFFSAIAYQIIAMLKNKVDPSVIIFFFP